MMGGSMMARRRARLPELVTHGWGQRGNYPLPPSKLDPETGKRLCRWCEFPVGEGRRYWCGAICVEEYNLRGNWNHLREHIIKRDVEKGCALCKGQRLGPTLPAERRDTGTDYPYLMRRRRMPDAQVWGPYNPVGLAWEVDHIKPVAEGGTDDPRNLRLLCVPCHRDVTRRWRRDKAAGPQIALLD